MAANLAALNNYLQNVLMIPDDDVRDGLNQQGLTAFDDLENLTEKDIAQICANVRKPGGVIANPNAAVAGQPATITNPGVLLGHAVEVRLKMFAYFVKHLIRIQRTPFVAGVATLARVVAVYKLKEVEDEEQTIELPPPLTKVDDVRATLEKVDDYLLRQLGDSGCPLAYVCRDDVALPVVDPGFGNPTYSAEMIARAPHIGVSFQRDSITVWTLIRHVCHGGFAWNWVSAFARTRNGRGAYLALKTHYLGESFVSRTRASADNRLETAYFDGKARNFTFENYCALLNNAFADLEGSGEAVSESRKLRVFLTGISDPRLEVAKSQVTATAALQTSFDTAVTFVSTFLETHRSQTNTVRGVSSVNNPAGSGGRGRGRGADRGAGQDGGADRGGTGHGAGGSDHNVSDRYYTPDEWDKLSFDERQAVRDKRSDRDRRRGVETDDRNVRPRTDATTPPAVAAEPPQQNTNNVSDVMSRRNTGGSNANGSFQQS